MKKNSVNEKRGNITKNEGKNFILIYAPSKEKIRHVNTNLLICIYLNIPGGKCYAKRTIT